MADTPVEIVDSDDEDLRAAIAMSLGQDLPPKRSSGKADSTKRSSVIDLTGDSEEEPTAEPTQPTEPMEPTEAAPTSSLSGLGLDRKKMEEERLERLKKRKASDLGQEGQSRPAQRIKTQEDSKAAGIERSDPPLPLHTPQNSEASSGSPSQHASASSLPFPEGVVKKTWVRGYPRCGDDITIEEVLQKDQLTLAVLSSFQWDDVWLMSKVDLFTTNVILVAFAADHAQQHTLRQNAPSDRVRFCFPRMKGPGAMHSKLQLLKFPQYLRVVVPTGNLVPYDWGEVGSVENAVFIIDLPKLDDVDQESSRQTPFFHDLCYFLRAQGHSPSLVKGLEKYDFSATAQYGFVHSIAGSHIADDVWQRTGHCGLGRAVAALGLASEAPIDLDYVCSSLGAVNNDLLHALYNACKGETGLKTLKARTEAPKTQKSTAPPDHQSYLSTNVRVYFPSRQTVLQSRGGKNSAGTICFQPRWWSSPNFPRQILCDYKSTRQGLLIHTKMLLVRLSSTPETPAGFAYVGSANLSESAWGRLVKDRGTGKPKLTCRNWECGVVVPTKPSNQQQAGLDVFRGRVPVPFKFPGSQYAAGQQPWFYQEG